MWVSEPGAPPHIGDLWQKTADNCRLFLRWRTLHSGWQVTSGPCAQPSASLIPLRPWGLVPWMPYTLAGCVGWVLGLPALPAWGSLQCLSSRKQPNRCIRINIWAQMALSQPCAWTLGSPHPGKHVHFKHLGKAINVSLVLSKKKKCYICNKKLLSAILRQWLNWPR